MKGALHQAAETDDATAEDDPVEASLREMEAQSAAMDSETMRLNAQVPRRLYERFKAKCERDERTMSSVLRDFLRAYVSD